VELNKTAADVRIVELTQQPQRRAAHSRSEIDADIIERAVHIIGHGYGAVVHPDHAEAFVIRQGFTCASLEDEFR
jgi:hypothetical protein